MKIIDKVLSHIFDWKVLQYIIMAMAHSNMVELDHVVSLDQVVMLKVVMLKVVMLLVIDWVVVRFYVEVDLSATTLLPVLK